LNIGLPKNEWQLLKTKETKTGKGVTFPFFVLDGGDLGSISGAIEGLAA
jgi:hypothetical protein